MPRAKGFIYHQPKSPFWWCSYQVNGKRVRESTKTDDPEAAQRFLAGKVAENKTPDKRTIDFLLDGLVANYEHNHRKGIDWCKIVVKAHLREHFGHLKAEALTKQAVLEYIA